MKTMTATTASRGFSDVLDLVEHGERILITRGGRPVAELRPAVPNTGRDLRLALAGLPPLDDELEGDIAAALDLATNEENGAWGDD